QLLDSLRSLVSGRRILQRFKPLSTAFFTAVDLSIEALPDDPGTANSLKLKEFSVPTAPEVGRIIERLNRASRVNSKNTEQRQNEHLI
ncbi:hypothetical protein, partial [Pseudomonas wadenswilerensis]|uniref:hypothetical protein n=1 Tax=Pseudomonas wadenswilerensis TaxID=1785161 RepID=UPI0039F098D3